MKSLLPTLSLAQDRGHIIVDFPIREIPYTERRTVADTYSKGNYPPDFGSHVVVALKLDDGDYLIVPREYGRCSFAQKTEPQSRPSKDHINHPMITKIIEGTREKP